VGQAGSSVSFQTVGTDTFLAMPYYDPEDSAPWDLIVSAVGEATGTITLEVSANPQPAPLTLGTSTTVTIVQPGLTVGRTFPAAYSRRDRVEVTASTLTHPDGTPGSVTVVKGDLNYPTTMGEISDQPAVLEDTEPVMATWSQVLGFVPDGRSTGTITFTVTRAPEPDPITLALGTPSPVALPTRYQNQFLTLPVTANSTYLLTFSDAALTSPTDSTSSTLIHLMSPGTSEWIRYRYWDYSGHLTQTQTTTSITYKAPSSGDLTILVNPVGDITGHLTVTATAVA
jgi:hypothetical protein